MRYLAKIIILWTLLAGGILLAIMLVTSANAVTFGIDKILEPFGHYIHGLTGYEDFVRLCISSAALMFFPYCQWRKGHISVDLFSAFLPLSVRQTLDKFWLLMFCALALFLFYWMALGMVETYHDNALSPVLGWPEWPFYLPGLVSLLLWAAAAMAQFWDTQANQEASQEANKAY